MAGRIYPIIVRKEYTDNRYREYLHQSFKLERSKYRRGRSKFVPFVMERLVEEHIEEISLDSTEPYQFQKPDFYQDYRDVSSYLANGRTPNSEAVFLRFIDAFMQLTITGFYAAFLDHQNSDQIGQMLGAYLRDPISADNRYHLASSAQSVEGIYKYEDVDTHQNLNGETRIVAFLPGENIDYLNIIDFHYEPGKLTTPYSNSKLDLICGFSIPGDKLSPVIMRTSRFRDRQLGLLYTPGNLTEMAGGVLDDFIYEVFTTDLDHQGEKSKSQKYDGDPLIAKALNIHYGPRLRKNLLPLSDKEKIEIEPFISKLKLSVM